MALIPVFSFIQDKISDEEKQKHYDNISTIFDSCRFDPEINVVPAEYGTKRKIYELVKDKLKERSKKSFVLIIGHVRSSVSSETLANTLNQLAVVNDPISLDLHCEEVNEEFMLPGSNTSVRVGCTGLTYAIFVPDSKAEEFLNGLQPIVSSFPPLLTTKATSQKKESTYDMSTMFVILILILIIIVFLLGNSNMQTIVLLLFIVLLVAIAKVMIDLV